MDSEKLFLICGAVCVVVVSICGATVQILNTRAQTAQTACIAAYASSTHSIEEIKKLCDGE